MAIQLPNPGLGDGQTGDNEFVMWTKVKDNFNNNSHAASRLVGKNGNNLVQASDVYEVFAKTGAGLLTEPPNEGKEVASGTQHLVRANEIGLAVSYFSRGNEFTYFTVGIMNQTNTRILHTATNAETGVMAKRTQSHDETWSSWNIFWGTTNTTVDSNGFIKKASPIVKLSSNGIECNDDANKQNIEFIKNSVGDYTLKNTSGLSTDGWYIELPQDVNKNPLVAVEYDDNNGDLNIKTYKRKFDIESANVVADLDQPLDIPEGRWIDLRFNDLPDEDDTQTEV